MLHNLKFNKFTVFVSKELLVAAVMNPEDLKRNYSDTC